MGISGVLNRVLPMLLMGVIAAHPAWSAESESGLETRIHNEVGYVARATFTSAVEEREPVDSIMSLSTDQVQIYYFTELRNLEGQTVVHRWEYDGAEIAAIEIKVGGPRWRVWSSKRLMRGWEGEWRVQVLNEAGEVLAEDRFTYMSPANSQ